MLLRVYSLYLYINKILTAENKPLCTIMVSKEKLTNAYNCLKFDEIWNVYHHFVNIYDNFKKEKMTQDTGNEKTLSYWWIDE